MDLSLEEVAVHDGHEVMVEFDNSGALIVGNIWGILDQHLRPRPICLLVTYSIVT